MSSRKRYATIITSPEQFTTVPLLPFWYETVEPVAAEQLHPLRENLPPTVLSSFLVAYKTAARKFNIGDRRHLSLDHLQEVVQCAWMDTALQHDLDLTLADAWFDWPGLVAKMMQQRQEDCEIMRTNKGF